MTSERWISRQSLIQTSAVCLTLLGLIVAVVRFTTNLEASQRSEHEARIISEQVIQKQIQSEIDGRVASDAAILRQVERLQERQEIVSDKLIQVATMLDAISKKR